MAREIILTELDSYDWESAFGENGNINPNVRPAVPGQRIELTAPKRSDVAKIIAIEEGQNDGDNWLLVAQLYDKRFICVSAGCDYTGWDCQAEGDIIIAASLDDALRYGLSEEERARLKVQLTEEGASIELSSKWKLRPIP